jgi:hypothetical protein
LFNICLTGEKGAKSYISNAKKELTDFYKKAPMSFDQKNLFEYVIISIGVAETSMNMLNKYCYHIPDYLSDAEKGLKEIKNQLPEIEFNIEQQDIMTKKEIKELKKNYGVS